MIITQDKTARSIVPDRMVLAVYQIIIVACAGCDLGVAQALADRERQPVLVYQRPQADPGDFAGYYEVSHVYPEAWHND